LEESARFATAAASLKVTRPGLQMFPITEIKQLATQLSVERQKLVDHLRH
jgi:fructose-1-phosphate kinase PfkB-like protein